jgi:hypothetical protein
LVRGGDDGKRGKRGREVPGVWAVLESRESAGMTRTPVCFHASSGTEVGGGGFGVEDSAISKDKGDAFIYKNI